jgi:hypothetical protein
LTVRRTTIPATPLRSEKHSLVEQRKQRNRRLGAKVYTSQMAGATL